MSTMFRERGFAIVSAIFLLVVLAALGGFIATVSTSQQIGSALDVVGARAYQAARTGSEWGLFQALKASSCVASTDIGVIDTISVTVICISTTPSEAGTSTNFYAITSIACNMPTGTTCPGSTSSPNYVERRIAVWAEH